MSSRSQRGIGAPTSGPSRRAPCLSADLTEVGERVAPSFAPPAVLSEPWHRSVLDMARPPSVLDDTTPKSSPVCGSARAMVCAVRRNATTHRSHCHEHHRPVAHAEQRRRAARPRPRGLPDAARRDARRRARRARRRLPPHRHRRRLRERARGRRRGPRVRPRPRRRLPRDQDLDLRLRLRRDAARLREERRQARRRADRPADPASGPARRLRPDPRGLPGARDAARRRQGPRDRRQQLHGRPPHRPPGPRRPSCPP